MIGKSWGEKIADVCIYAVMLLLMLAMVYPVWYVIVASFSNSTEIAKNPGIMFWPKTFELQAYRMVFVHPMFRRGFLNTIRILAVGIPFSMFLTLLCGYFMSLKGMKLKGILVGFITFTMFFGGGLIPTYLVVKQLKMLNTVWALLLPTAMSVWNMIIARTYFQNSIPAGLEEAATIDGCSNLKLFFQIILPLSQPIIAVLILYYAVGHWNEYFNALIYLNDQNIYPLQLILRNILLLDQMFDMMDSDPEARQEMMRLLQMKESMKFGIIVLSTLPVMVLYPFLQKFFVKGVMIGAIKG